MGVKNFLYTVLKYHNDLEAVTKSAQRRSAKPLVHRGVRRVSGKAHGRFLGWLLR